jgi:tRNA (guanine-N7-)-methyltransferase
LGINVSHDAGVGKPMRDDVRMRAQCGAEPAVRAADTSPPAASDLPHQHRRVASFRSRRSTLRPGQQLTWDALWPVLGAQVRHADRSPGRLDWPQWFGRSAPLVLEIGCGNGASTVAMAQAEPDVDVVAVEVYRRGLAQLLSAIDREHVTNIRLVRGDGIDVLEHLLSPGCLTGVRVFFPDPWPKSRHHKRRLLQAPTVALITDRLRPGGVLHAATDHPGYAEQIADVGDGEPRLRRAVAGARLPISVRRPTTKYETKAQRAGSAVTELVWERI